MANTATPTAPELLVVVTELMAALNLDTSSKGDLESAKTKAAALLQRYTLPKLGDKVRLHSDADRFSNFIIPAGATGVVTEVNADIIVIKMDEPFEGGEDWDNSLQITEVNNDQNLAQEFALEAEVIA
jgi:hypothetical protein